MMKPTSRILCYFASAALFASMNTSLFAEEAPRLVQKDGRYALLVDGKPFLMLGGQIHNSSAWPAEMPQVMQSLESLHANTIEAPVYWEQMEPEQGRFDFTNVDSLLNAAREHHLRVISAQFATMARRLTRFSQDRLLQTCWGSFARRQGLGPRSLGMTRARFFRPTTKPITSTKLLLRARQPSQFLFTSTYGLAIRPRSCRSGECRCPAFNIPAEELCRVWSVSGARWHLRLT
jgi:hypothetical protein